MTTIVQTSLADISRRFGPTDDLSAIGSSTPDRLSPTPAAQPQSAHSRKSSTSDSAFYEYDTNETSALSSNDLLEKFEERLRLLEARLKEESQERSKLAVKVAKLEEENETLKANRQNAISQLQTFSEKFFAMKEPLAPKFDPSSPVFTSPLNSPRGSHMELRRTGSSSSMASRASRQSMKSRSRPTSGISL